MRPAQAAVQRMEVTSSASVSHTSQATVEEHLNRMGYRVEATAAKMRQIRGTNLFLEPKLATSVNNEVFNQVANLLIGNSWKLYRAVPRFHPNWSEASKGRAKPLGKGTASFDTGSAAWTAWQDHPEASVGMAVSVSGMGAKDQIESVSGYSKSDEFVVAVVLETTVTGTTPLCFFNSGEVQIRGEVGSSVHREIKMGTKLSDLEALAHYANSERTKVADLMPDPS